LGQRIFNSSSPRNREAIFNSAKRGSSSDFDFQRLKHRCDMKRFQTCKIKNLATFVVLSSLVLLGSCAYQPDPSAADPPGFFSGMLHGFLIFFSLVGSIFTEARIYSFPNNGGWYDFGYFLGASVFLGGGGASAR